MIKITAAAQARLQHLLIEHPEERIVRITITDMDEERFAMSLTLESGPQADDDDEVQDVSGLTIAIPQSSVARLDGVTLDYTDSEGFQLHHPNPPMQELRVISLN